MGYLWLSLSLMIFQLDFWSSPSCLLWLTQQLLISYISTETCAPGNSIPMMYGNYQKGNQVILVPDGCFFNQSGKQTLDNSLDSLVVQVHAYPLVPERQWKFEDMYQNRRILAQK